MLLNVPAIALDQGYPMGAARSPSKALLRLMDRSPGYRVQLLRAPLCRPLGEVPEPVLARPSPKSKRLLRRQGNLRLGTTFAEARWRGGTNCVRLVVLRTDVLVDDLSARAFR